MSELTPIDELVQKILGGSRKKKHSVFPKVNMSTSITTMRGGEDRAFVDHVVVEDHDELVGGDTEDVAGGKTVYVAKNGSRYVKDKNGRPKFISGSNKSWMKQIRSKPRSKKCKCSKKRSKK